MKRNPPLGSLHPSELGDLQTNAGIAINRGRSGFKGGAENIHPYLKRTFWLNSSNHFWESASYSEKTKQYYRDIHGITFNH